MDEEREVEGLITPVSNEDTNSVSQQQLGRQLVIVTGIHDEETEVMSAVWFGL